MVIADIACKVERHCVALVALAGTALEVKNLRQALLGTSFGAVKQRVWQVQVREACSEELSCNSIGCRLTMTLKSKSICRGDMTLVSILSTERSDNGGRACCNDYATSLEASPGQQSAAGVIFVTSG